MQFLRIFVVLVLTAVPVLGQETPVQVDLAGINLNASTLKRIRRNPQQYLQSMIQQLFKFSPDGVVTPQSAALQEERNIAQSRAQFLARILRFDLDGDLAISTQEMVRQTQLINSDSRAQLANLQAAVDSNFDGALQTDEIMSYVAEQVQGLNMGRTNLAALMAFDANKNSSVTVEEVRAVIRAVMDNPDFKVATASELKLLKERETLHQCGIVQPSPLAKVVMLGTGRAGYQSDVALGDRDRTTGVVRLHVDAGDAPVYLLAFSREAVIWALEGAVSRVERIVVARGNGGVSGIDPARIALVSQEGCLPNRYSSIRSQNTRINSWRLAKVLGHEVLPAIVAKKMAHVHVPSGVEEVKLKYRPPERDKIMRLGKIQWHTPNGWQPAPTWFLTLQKLRHARFQDYPGGIRSMDPTQITAQPAAEKYQVMPRAAGLIQLIHEGALVPKEDGRFHLVKPIPRLPADMQSILKITYQLGPNVADLPPGDPGAAQVLAADGVTCLAGPRCN